MVKEKDPEFVTTSEYKVTTKTGHGPKGDKLTLVVEEGKRPSFLEERSSPRRLSPEEHHFILNFLPEFDRIWKAIKGLGSVSRTPSDKQRDIALAYLHSHDLQCINERSLKASDPWKGWRSGREKSDFRGKLLQELFADYFPDAPPYGYELIEKTAKKIEADVKRIP